MVRNYNWSGRLLRGVAFITATGLAFSFTAVPSAQAQRGQMGTVSGTVRDTRGNALPGARVAFDHVGRAATTRADGGYEIRNVPVGTYALRVRLLGFRSQAETVAVRADATATQDFTLGSDPLLMDAVVVTGAREPRLKLESSSAITTLSRADIEATQARSTADLLKSIPGFYVESSGGEVNNNLFARGLPADGSYRYVVFMENGMPAYDPNDLFFLGADNFVRTDENVGRLEAIRGGSSALFGSNAPGGVVNIIDKTGGPSLSGAVKVTGGSSGLFRYDMNVNGPIADDWRFSIGGYYRYDDGIRDPGFPAARGGQFKANVSRFFDQGYVTVYAKYINDKNIFYLPLPLVQGETSGSVVKLKSEFVPGFPSDGTMTTRDGSFRRIPLPENNGELTMPLENGIAQVGGSILADVGFDFANDWTVQNMLRVTKLDHQWNAILPFEIVDANTWAGGFAGAGETAELSPVPPGGLLSLGGFWHVEKPVTNVSNQLLVRKRIPGRTSHSITVGGYFGHYTANNRWFFNDIVTEVAHQPQFVNLVIRDAGGSIVRRVTDNGFRAYLPFYVNAFGNATLVSVFAGDEIQLSNRIRIDVGARYEHDDYEQNAENTSTFDLGGPSDADDALTWGDRTYTRRSVNFDEWAASVGINYALNNQISLYGRGSRGYKMPLLDQYLFEQFPDTAETLWQAEGGVKVSTPTLGLSAVAYWLQLEDFPSQDAVVVGGVTQFVTALVGKARTIGAEVEAVVEPTPGLQLNGLATFQEHEYTSFIEGGEDRSGNWVRRIPKILFRLGGSYSNSGFTIGGDWNYFGKRFSDNANTIELPQFGYVNVRASYAVPLQGVTLSAAVLNLADGAGLTEGNPRLDPSGAPSGPALARPILPRRFVFGARYDF